MYTDQKAAFGGSKQVAVARVATTETKAQRSRPNHRPPWHRLGHRRSKHASVPKCRYETSYHR